MKIDIHSHIIPKGYLNELLKHKSIPRIEKTEDGQYALWYGKRLKYFFDERMYSSDWKLKIMGKSGIDMQVLSVAMPGLDLLEPKSGLRLARKVNDEMEQIVADYPNKFLGIATVPLQDVGEAVDELDRAINTLGFKGVEIFSNMAGTPIDDERFFPFYEKLAKLNVPMLIHPARPLMAEVTKDYGLTGVVGYLFDTTLATLRMVFSGILEKYPTLKIVLPHLGSTIPYLIGRIDNQFKMNAECRVKISKMPSEYLKLIYIDTAQSLYKPAIACAFAFLGSDKILFGSDYPFADLKYSAETVDAMDISNDDKSKIFYKNAMNLLNIE